MSDPNPSPPSDRKRNWFPPSTLAELLLLFILVALVLSTWLQTKRDLEGPRDWYILTMHENQPRAAIYSPTGLRVVDCVTGKTLLKLPSIPHYVAEPESPGSPWHAWPGSYATFAWTNKFNPGRVIVNGTGFTPNLDVDFRDGWFTQDEFHSDKIAITNIRVPSDNFQMSGLRPVRFAFTPSGNALIIRVNIPDGIHEYQIFDLQTGRKTTYKNAADRSGLATRMVTQGDLVIFGTADRQIDKLIDPAVGFVDPSDFPDAGKALEHSSSDAPHFPIHATDEQSKKVLLTLLPKDGISLIVEPDVEGKDLTSLQEAKTVWKWDTEPNRSWQSPSRLVFWNMRGNQTPHQSNVWIVESKAPYLRTTAWPFEKDEIVDQLTMEVDVRGMTAMRAKRIDPAINTAATTTPEHIYWDFENARAVKSPQEAHQTRRYGDHIVAQTRDQLITIDLNTGKHVRTIPLKTGVRPPLIFGWLIWLAAWAFVKRNATANDLTRQVGFITAAFFALCIALSYYYTPDLDWLLQLLLLLALLVGLIVTAILRKASVISLTLCGLLTLGLLFSGLQRGFGKYPPDPFGLAGAPAGILADRLAATTLESPKEILTSLLEPWTTPQKTPHPAPIVTIETK